MRGLVFDPSPARLLVAGLASRLSPAGALGPGSPLRLRELPDPVPPGPDWVELRPVVCGICGSDVHEACLDADSANPLSAVVAFPHVMGHEVVARLPDGALAAVDPWLTCQARGESEPCRACRAGQPPLCEHVTAGGGMHIGNMPALPGGFATRMLAHATQVHRLPDGLDPVVAALADPLAVGAHAVDRARPEESPGPAVVLGAGTIGLAAAATLVERGAGPVLVSAAWPHTRALVEAAGGLAVGTSAAAVVEAVARATGEQPARPWRGGPWLRRGAPVVVDTIGSAATIETAYRVVGRRGRVVVVGVGRPGRVDSTLVTFKEVEVLGSNAYGRGAIPAALERLGSGHHRYGRWVTHRFPLAAWRRAFAAARQPGRSGAVKVLVEVSPC
jgi:threonine dehydrogenase-like Zn-dependent dehydrogenase